MYKSIFASVAAIALAGAASATTLTFDDLTGASFDNVIPNGYGGLNWNNFNSANTPDVFASYGPNGYSNGVVSPDRVAFNAFANPASFYAGYDFVFASGYFTGSWNDGLELRIEAFNDGSSIWSQTLTLNTAGPLFATFSNALVDEVRFASTGGINPGLGGAGAHFNMDNLSFQGLRSAVPEPASWAMMVIGFGVVGSAMRRRQRTSVSFA